MSTANEPDDVTPALRVEIVGGGDPGVEVLAAVAAVLTRPVVVPEVTDDPDKDEPVERSRWRHAALLEGVVPGRRITSIADLAWRRGA